MKNDYQPVQHVVPMSQERYENQGIVYLVPVSVDCILSFFSNQFEISRFSINSGVPIGLVTYYSPNARRFYSPMDIGAVIVVRNRNFPNFLNGSVSPKVTLVVNVLVYHKAENYFSN